MAYTSALRPPLLPTVRRVALGAFALWLVPLVASRVVEGWHWGPGAFVVTYLLFFLTGMAYALIARKMDTWTYKAAVALALVTGFVLAWSTMVHLSETENQANFAYFGVLAIGAIGAGVARLEARGLARTMFAMAMASMLAWLLTQVIWPDSPAGPLWNLLVAHGGLVGLLVTSGLLFRSAAATHNRPAL